MSTSSSAKTVNQFLPSLWYGDAISNHAVAIRDTLRAAGYETGIYAEHIHEKLSRDAMLYQSYKGSPEHIAIYHLSIGSPVSAFVRNLPDKRILIYHNITPSSFFEEYNPEAVQTTRYGRQEIRMLLPDTRLALGDSAYNEAELQSYGYKNTGVLPIMLDFEKIGGEINQDLYTTLNDGKVTVLFVGRVTPHKSQHDIIKAFGVYQKSVNPSSRLILVGSSGSDRYLQELEQLVKDLELTDVHLAGTASLQDLRTYYRLATVFLSMSEHEGFLVPLVESMYWKVPIIAYAAGAIPDTLGSAGIQFTKKDFPVVAELIDLVVRDAGLRERIIAAEQQELRRFQPERVKKLLLEFIRSV